MSRVRFKLVGLLALVVLVGGMMMLTTTAMAKTPLKGEITPTIQLRDNGKIDINWDPIPGAVSYAIRFEGSGEKAPWRVRAKTTLPYHSYLLLPRRIVPSSVSMLAAQVAPVDANGKQGDWTELSPTLFLAQGIHVSKDKQIVTFGWPVDANAVGYNLRIKGTIAADSMMDWSWKSSVAQSSAPQLSLQRGCGVQPSDSIVMQVRSVHADGSKGAWSAESAGTPLPKTVAERAAVLKLINSGSVADTPEFTFASMPGATSRVVRLFGRADSSDSWSVIERVYQKASETPVVNFSAVAAPITQVYGYVKHSNAAGNVIACVQTSIATIVPPPVSVPAAPKIEVDNGRNSDIIVSWDAVAGAISYDVQVQPRYVTLDTGKVITNDLIFNPPKLSRTGVTSTTFAGLKQGCDFDAVWRLYARVRAVDGYGNSSAWSAESNMFTYTDPNLQTGTSIKLTSDNTVAFGFPKVTQVSGDQFTYELFGRADASKPFVSLDSVHVSGEPYGQWIFKKAFLAHFNQVYAVLSRHRGDDTVTLAESRCLLIHRGW